MQLHREITDFKKTKLYFDAETTSDIILNKSKKVIPSGSSFTSLLGGVASIGSCVLLGIICLPMTIKLLVNFQWKFDSELNSVKLHIIP